MTVSKDLPNSEEPLSRLMLVFDTVLDIFSIRISCTIITRAFKLNIHIDKIIIICLFCFMWVISELNLGHFLGSMSFKNILLGDTSHSDTCVI